MDPRFPQYYERELRYLRELASEFARDFPKLAARLGLSELECADPQVERLLQGFSFSAAGVHLKLDAEFAEVTTRLLARIYPNVLSPTPSMMVLQLEPSAHETSLLDGALVPRGTAVRARVNTRSTLSCEYRTARDVSLWPIEIEEVEYTPVLQELAALQYPAFEQAKALLRIRLRATAGATFDQLALDRLPVFMHGGDALAFHLYEHLVSDSLGLFARSVRRRDLLVSASDSQPIKALGFDAAESLMPPALHGLQGHQLVHQYFAFPSAFAFVELGGLASALRRCPSDAIDLLIPVKRHQPQLDAVLDPTRLRLFATPAVNLFPRECARVVLTDAMEDVHLMADSTRPKELEIHSITNVVAYGAGAEISHPLSPIHAAQDPLRSEGPVRYRTERRPDRLSAQHSGAGEYTASNVYLTLVDHGRPALPKAIRQLAVTALCTNRDLPLALRAAGKSELSFKVMGGAPVANARCLAGPTAPRAVPLDGSLGWQMLSHLSLNHLSLSDASANGAKGLRGLLELYAALGDPAIMRHAQAVRSIASRPVVRPLPIPGPMCFGRGLEISVQCEAQGFDGGSAFLLGSVLARFFGKHTATNSFSETVLRKTDGTEVFRWPAIAGTRPIT